MAAVSSFNNPPPISTDLSEKALSFYHDNKTYDLSHNEHQYENQGEGRH